MGMESMVSAEAVLQTELLDVQAVARLLACSPRHVHRLAAAGRMPPPVKLGWLTRWSRAGITRWITDGCRPVRGEKGGAA